MRCGLEVIACFVLLFDAGGCSSPPGDAPPEKGESPAAPTTDNRSVPTTDKGPAQVSPASKTAALSAAKNDSSAGPPLNADTDASGTDPREETASEKSGEEKKTASRRCVPARNCCSQNTDCVSLEKANPCACPPCGKVKRWTLNKRGYRQYIRRWARRRCAPRTCTPCEGRYVGKAVCLDGKCVVC